MGASPRNEAKAGGRAPLCHVIILDGTLSSLHEACQTNAARTYTLLKEVGPPVSLYYEPGLQWNDWRSVFHVATGRGINRQIRRAYGYLASRSRPGDRIFLFGYSRGAYAVRSLAGVIDLIGLLRAERATERNVTMAYRHYALDPESPAAEGFRKHLCHPDVSIEMIGVWDTVKSLGVNAPVLWRWSERTHAFHNHDLGAHIRNGFHALAHDENRVAYAPVLWQSDDTFAGRVEQMWFLGAHGDVGGQLGGFEEARPLANNPLVWMLEKAGNCGLPLPTDWQGRFPQDPLAPARGTWRGYGRLLLTRRKRVIGADPSERIHPSVAQRQSQQAEGGDKTEPVQT
jgi:uncharacterized protein (DUF2235 family)